MQIDNAISAVAKFPKLCYLFLKFPLISTELPRVRGGTSPPVGPSPLVTAEDCQRMFNKVLAAQETHHSALSASNQTLKMLVIKVGEWEWFTGSGRFCLVRYMWVCRRINGVIRSWFVKDRKNIRRDEDVEDILLSLGFSVPWDPSRSPFETKREKVPNPKPGPRLPTAKQDEMRFPRMPGHRLRARASFRRAES